MKCVYAIHNDVTDLYYVGSTVNFSKRKTSHYNLLRKGCHSNKHLQQDYNTYGEEHFNIYVLQSVENEEQLKPLEEKYISEFLGKCYNVYSHCNYLNKSVRKKISKKVSGVKNGNYNRQHTDDEKKKIRDNRYGEDYICKPKKCSYVRKTPEELAMSRKKMSELMTGRTLSDSTKEKIRQHRTGKKASESVRKKMSENRKGSNNSNSKLTKEQVLEIYERMNKGEHYSVICAEFNIGQTQAYKIKRKEHWVFYAEERNN